MENKVIIKKDGREIEASISQTFISNVFSYMFAALTITGVIAWWFGGSAELMSMIINFETGGLNGLGYVAIFAPFAFVMVMTFAYERLGSLLLLLLFIAFSVLMGISMSTIFLAYTASSITSTFFVTAITFGIMALVGYTTKTDLTKLGSLLMMGLFGIVIAMIFNWFIGSETLEIIISLIGVVIFTGLAAYDVQKLKRIGAGVEFGSESANKLAILGALTLYLDFINLFLFLLRFMGDRK
ncbi:MAG TPA: BAX inhibitor (BI)-1/YccA family protein [Flavobacteriales bacterium]|nr:BAX inhibitor (BI)-1/YccA family protein [Flavobacteriales bacterium]